MFCSRRLYLSVQWPINEKRHWNSQGVCFILDISTISVQANKTELCDTIFKVGLLRFCLFKHTYININMAWTELRWFGNITIPYLGCKLHGNGAGDRACMRILKKYTLLLIRKECFPCAAAFSWFASLTFCPGLIVGAILPKTRYREFHKAFGKPVIHNWQTWYVHKWH